MKLKMTLAVALILNFSFDCVISAHAAVPLRWTVETSRVAPAALDAYHGETLHLEATLKSYGAPIAPGDGEASIYWQTNGMGTAYWSAPATCSNNVLSADFTPSMDPGAAVVHGFIGLPGDIYRAAFTLRFRASPGASPNAIELPVRILDFATIEVSNAPWLTSFTETDPMVPDWAKAETQPLPPDYSNVSNKAMTALQEHQDISGKLDKSGGTMTGALVMEEPIVIKGAGLAGVQFGDTVLYVLDGNGLPSRILTYSEIAQTSDIPTSMAWGSITGKPTFATVATSGAYSDLSGKPTIPTTAAEVGAYSTGDVDLILQGYLPLDYFKESQTIPMYLGDGTKLCDFGANWIGVLASDVQNNSDAIDEIRADVDRMITLKADKVKTVVTTTILDGETFVETNYYPTVYLDDIAPFTAATNKIEMARRAIENADLSTVSGLSAALEAVKNTLGE